MTPHPGKAGPDTAVVLLGAFCLFLSTLEYLIPKPLPFIRIGLANLPLMLALDLLSPRYFGLLALIKIAGAGIVGGTIFSYVFVFSLAGSAASALVMYSLRRVSAGSRHSHSGTCRKSSPDQARLSLAGIGVAGAVCSSVVQLLLARFLIFGEGVRYLIPPFLALSLVTGCVLGLFSEQFCRRSRWYRAALDGETCNTLNDVPAGAGGQSRAPMQTRRQARRARWDGLFDGSELTIAGIAALLMFLFTPSTFGRILQFLFFWFCAWLSGRKNSPLMTLSVIAGIVLVNLLIPYGRVLTEIGPLHITAGSLADGLRKAVTLEGLVMLSAAVIGGRPSSGGFLFGGKPGWVPLCPGVGRRIVVFGRLLGKSLSLFAVLREGGVRVRPGHFIDDVDVLFMKMDWFSPVENEKTEISAVKRHPGFVFGRLWLVAGLGITLILMVLPFFLSRFLPNLVCF
ncbi:MAG: Gx transporter family protein [Treponema sp.]|nr:Gx transporter family protein [Treponema sp.]